MNLKGIITVSGVGGLFKILAQTRNSGLLVESLVDGKRQPIHASSKVSSLDDISIFSQAEDTPLKEVFAKMLSHFKDAAIEEIPKDQEKVKEMFSAAFPEYDQERVYVSDMKKVLTWYNLLLAKGFMHAEPEADDKSAEESIPSKDAIKAAPKPKESPKTSSPKASSKGMTKTATVRKTA